jgi:UDP-N-acetylmuramoyl-tripeptide--D-alanyl-D-alanine ligase
MYDLTLGQIADIVEGQLVGNAGLIVSGVTTDSRTSSRGDLFGAIVGSRIDGHDCIEEAMASGVVAALVSRKVTGPHVLVPKSPDELDPVIHALAKLATHVRKLMVNVEVVGITGSSGKTSTKDMIGQVLSHAGKTHAPAGSLNNELGLPLTILSAPTNLKYLITEMGMRGMNQITQLCSIAQPSIGVVTNVGHAHIGEVGSVENIAKAKSELIKALPADGVAILNADDPRVTAMRTITQATIFSYGFSSEADVRAEHVAINGNGTYDFDLVYGGNRVSTSIPMLGEHNISNALAAATVGLAVGMELEDIAAALTALKQMSKWRMEVIQLPGEVTIINDAYNANPESMSAALETLASIPAKGKTWAVVGKMHELGESSDQLHEQVITHANQLGISHVVAVGEPAASFGLVNSGESDAKAVWLHDFALATDYIINGVNSGDVLLFKASRAEKFELLAKEIEDRLRKKWSQP